jgi:glycosyltransferase involved in cell wall biosynthesis
MPLFFQKTDVTTPVKAQAQPHGDDFPPKTTCILFLIDTFFSLAGAEKNIYHLLSNLDKKNWNPILVCLDRCYVNEKLLSTGCKIVSCHLKRLYHPKAFFCFLNLVTLIRRQKVKLIISYFESADILGLALAKFTGVPIISSRRDIGFNLSRRILLVYKCINRYFNKITVVSEAVKYELIRAQKLDNKKIKTIYNGIAVSDFSEIKSNPAKKSFGLNDDYPVVAMIANIRPVKGHIYFIHAASIILKSRNYVQFLIVGGDLSIDGSFQRKLGQLAKRLKVADNVLFLGRRDDISRVLAAVDVLVAPSLTEGFSNVILEAMAAGKPVVATNVDGNREAVLHGKTGLLVAPRDSHSLAHAVGRLLTDASLAKNMGCAGRKRVETYFTVETMINANQDLYRSVIENAKRQ